MADYGIKGVFIQQSPKPTAGFPDSPRFASPDPPNDPNRHSECPDLIAEFSVKAHREGRFHLWTKVLPRCDG